MNREQTKALLPTITHWVDGGEIDFRYKPRVGSSADWSQFTGFDPDFLRGDLEWRIRPEPKWRPWKPEEVPKMVAVTDRLTGHHYLIDRGHDWHTGKEYPPDVMFASFLRVMEDGSFTACGVLES